MENIEDKIIEIKEKLPDIIPTPPKFHREATAYEVKSRVNGGEPGLSIVDVRDNTAFREGRITGAINIPLSDLEKTATSTLLIDRDIYVYGANEEETAGAVNTLTGLGFTRVSQLKGGLTDWHRIEGQMEGIKTNDVAANPSEFNVVARLKKFAEQKAIEKQMKQDSSGCSLSS